jgi:hypothetical protein
MVKDLRRGAVARVRETVGGQTNNTAYVFLKLYLSVHNEEAKPDEVLYHFCSPTYGIAVPMTKGEIIVFNPLVDHCATNLRRDTTLIYSAYVSNKTCNTVVANAMDDLEY